jgi:hypothetical protein
MISQVKDQPFKRKIDISHGPEQAKVELGAIAR